MRATAILLTFAVLALVFATGCSSIPSAHGQHMDAASPTGQHYGTQSVIYKNTRPRPLTGYENVEQPAEYKWW